MKNESTKTDEQLAAAYNSSILSQPLYGILKRGLSSVRDSSGSVLIIEYTIHANQGLDL